MLLIYSENTSTRLQYICRFLFEEVMGLSYSLTLHAESFAAHEGSKINYSLRDFDNTYRITPHQLLFEKQIRQQESEAEGKEEDLIFFKTKNGDHGFDILAASFYLISRYEEYLPHDKDFYGRYAHENSAAYKNNFLHLPLVNIWASRLKEKLRERFPADKMFAESHAAFQFTPTYDIDTAWSYKNKGWLRTIGGLFRYPSFSRLATLAGLQKDPSDSYAFLHQLHLLNGLSPKYFFLVAKEYGGYDRNISAEHSAMQQLISIHAEKAEIGLHPSWKSNEDIKTLMAEKQMLQDISNRKISSSRQHYIKFNLPETYQRLIAAGITADYSMGYGSINGFRASVATPFNWYDLSKEAITGLKIYPFCFMDANCHYEEKLTPAQSFESLMKYYLLCKKYNGRLITIFHNNFLGTDKKFEGWRELYKKFISGLG